MFNKNELEDSGTFREKIIKQVEMEMILIDEKKIAEFNKKLENIFA